MKRQLILRDFESRLLLNRGEMLGWEETTPVDLPAEPESSRLIIFRHNAWCCICGGGSFRRTINIGGRVVCERCASEIGQAFARHNHRDEKIAQKARATKSANVADANRIAEMVRIAEKAEREAGVKAE